ncbi:hypothetical protein [Sulfobacillus thermosulfidooxidans]|uniref:hypothetical protein n=1 Tax=Sulfobacillus thermosulfidooxidans TaxID=28034 RepID=UPI00096B6F77|nr:hypothetical protein [Sulfobacillus thermosulfidooxidans]OLZ11708.1 hypothetical protein BFX05_06855 [Sulfobacillus thermosulfidooxidans]OLZ18671.1 hypothetical protein BFX06_00450 [Sulfobacillus thermosulfidooxidans]OLZ20250.1 hypothetical protein BFX07_01350 [Sulfobacillus thermosulfidooxidans]
MIRVSKRSYRWLALPLPLSLMMILAGCGFHSASTTHHTIQAHSSTAPTASPSPSPSPSPSSVPSSVAPSPSQSSTTPSQDQSVTPPPPPGAGSYRELHIVVEHATNEGTTTINGQSLQIDLLTLKVENPTSGIIGLALNDVSVLAGNNSYSWNDFSSKGLSENNSLFPYPPTPKSPSADVTQILPDRPLTGDITVLVPARSSYELVFNGTTDPTSSQATFSS